MIRRSVFTFASTVSLLLCAAIVMLWVRSHWRSDSAGHTWAAVPEQRIVTLVVESNRGLILIEHAVADLPPGQSEYFQVAFNWMEHKPFWQSKRAFPGRVDVGPRLWNRVGFGYERFSDGTFMTVRQCALPDWFLVLLFGVLPATWAVKRIRASRRNRPGRCKSCGYNLTGNTSGICPECGTPAAKEVRT